MNVNLTYTRRFNLIPKLSAGIGFGLMMGKIHPFEGNYYKTEQVLTSPPVLFNLNE
jgi:hypothetical protein